MGRGKFKAKEGILTEVQSLETVKSFAETLDFSDDPGTKVYQVTAHRQSLSLEFRYFQEKVMFNIHDWLDAHQLWLHATMALAACRSTVRDAGPVAKATLGSTTITPLFEAIHSPATLLAHLWAWDVIGTVYASDMIA